MLDVDPRQQQHGYGLRQRLRLTATATATATATPKAHAQFVEAGGIQMVSEAISTHGHADTEMKRDAEYVLASVIPKEILDQA